LAFFMSFLANELFVTFGVCVCVAMVFNNKLQNLYLKLNFYEFSK
jgi:hypothetical protein